MSPKLALLGLLDLAIGVVLLVATDTTLGTVAGWVLVVTGAAVVTATMLRGRSGEPSPDAGLRRAAADEQRQQGATDAEAENAEDRPPPTGA